MLIRFANGATYSSIENRNNGTLDSSRAEGLLVQQHCCMLRMSQGVTHIGTRYFPNGSCYSIPSCLNTDALLDLLGLVLMYLSTRNPSNTDVPSEGRLPAYLSEHTVG